MYFQDDFNVDQFVLECRRRVQLEDLRDDLSVYLKILRSAMIELINKDYADFVNLSSNLVSSHSSSIYSVIEHFSFQNSPKIRYMYMYCSIPQYSSSLCNVIDKGFFSEAFLFKPPGGPSPPSGLNRKPRKNPLFSL